jgi:hypothetical protein
VDVMPMEKASRIGARPSPHLASQARGKVQDIERAASLRWAL